ALRSSRKPRATAPQAIDPIARIQKRTERGVLMSFSRFFIDRPIFAGVISAIIFIAGLIAIPRLPISEYPEVVPPSVQVTAQFPGANPVTVADTVATPLEE